MHCVRERSDYSSRVTVHTTGAGDGNGGKDDRGGASFKRGPGQRGVLAPRPASIGWGGLSSLGLSATEATGYDTHPDTDRGLYFFTSYTPGIVHTELAYLSEPI